MKILVIEDTIDRRRHGRVARGGARRILVISLVGAATAGVADRCADSRRSAPMSRR